MITPKKQDQTNKSSMVAEVSSSHSIGPTGPMLHPPPLPPPSSSSSPSVDVVPTGGLVSDSPSTARRYNTCLWELRQRERERGKR